MQEAVRLGVSLDRQRADHPVGRRPRGCAGPSARRGRRGPEVVARRSRWSRRSRRRQAGSWAQPRTTRTVAGDPYDGGVTRDRRADRPAHDHRARRRPAAPARRALAGLPRVLRPAGGELLDHHRPADQRGLRVHRHAHQRPARRDADATSPSPSTCRRRPSATTPTRRTRRPATRRRQDFKRPGQPDPRGARGARDPVGVGLRLRGRRRHRHPRHAGRGRGHGRADRHRRPRCSSSWSPTG